MSKYLKNSINCTLFRNNNFRKSKLQKLILLSLSITLTSTLVSCNSDAKKLNQPTEKLAFSENLVKELKAELDFTKKQLCTTKELPEIKNQIDLASVETNLSSTNEYIEYNIENNGFINLNYFSPIVFYVE